ncbi:MAG: long-chain fatty acid--CoA ligase [Candidatus Afipia apatlaquensis]|uniref:Long-chain fatty acid--CoA ligase n=1 Tax=Candidatus Afipia apatlaquensis TaxID=2712852 RepID=A0A7C9VJ64_9BRAD|nr:long-chain fatty acid--CoA ligase [Candidatus Afipia apatlaquensis]
MPNDKQSPKTWPRRFPASIEPPATSLWDSVAVNARRYPDRAALMFFGSRTTYRELKEASERLAGRLHTLGVERGDRVLVVMQNCPQLVISHLAIARANAVVVPVNPMNRAEEMRHYISDARAKVGITTADLAPELAAASNAMELDEGLAHLLVSHFTDAIAPGDRPGVPSQWRDWLLSRHELPKLASGSVHHWRDAIETGGKSPDLEVARDDLALLPYTSGTTGLPKGCMLTHGNVMHNAVGSSLWLGMTPETANLTVLPLFHITGLVCVMHASIFSGGTMVIMPRWNRELAGQLISQYRVSHWTSIPTMIIDLLASPNLGSFNLSSLAYIGGGGAAMPQAVAETLLDKFGLKFVEGYGMTESAAVTLFNPCDDPKLQCLGIPFLSVDARIVDFESGAELPDNEQGEIVVHGPQVFKGYWKRDEASRETLVTIDGKTFLRTGDIGYRDADGYYFITDRLKRMINASGYKVWPAEIETLLFRHPAIQEACVIASKDDYRGETVKAVVVVKPSHAGVNEDEIIAWCRTRVSSYKVPRFIKFADSLPKSASGKVMWRVLQETELRKT